MVPEIEQYVNAAYRAREEEAEQRERTEKARCEKWVSRAKAFVEEHNLTPLLNALGIDWHYPPAFPDSGWIQIAYPLTLEIGGHIYNLEFGVGHDDAGIPCQMLRCRDLDCMVVLPASQAQIGEFLINLHECANEVCDDTGD